MALYHLTVSQIRRSAGQSAIAAAAYRAGECLYSDYYGEYSDYTRKGGVICSEILLPPHAPLEYQDRATLWNTVEQVEKHKKAQLAYSFDIALQNELSMEENIALAREFVQRCLVDKGKTPSLADLLISYYQDRNAGAWSQKAKGKNLKEFAEAVNYLMENKLLTLEALESRLSAVSTEFDTLSDTMKAKSARMKELQELIRQAENYKRLKPVYDELNGIKWKKQREKFETAHDADLRLFYTARRILKEKLDRKPITLAAWKQEYDRLQAEYAKLSPQYKPLREDLMKMRRVQYCVDRVLQRRQPEQEAPKKKQDIEL